MDICSVLGIPVSRCNLQQAVENVIALATEQREGPPHYVATLNLDFLSNAFYPRKKKEEGKELFETLRTASFVTADGMPIVWLCNALRQPLPGRVTGADLFLPLVAMAEKKELSLYLLGGEEATLKTTVAKLRSSHPNLRIVGHDCPMITLCDSPQPSLEDASIVKKINQCRPDILILSLGNPKQELWFNRNRDQLDVGVALGLGGTINFVAKNTKRAPEWVQKGGMEWLYRLSQEPKRLWQRYARNALHLPKLLLPPIVSSTLAKRKLPPSYSITLRPSRDAPPLLSLATPNCAEALPEEGERLLDLRDLPFLDASLATQLVAQFRSFDGTLPYLHDQQRTIWSVSAHGLDSWLTPKSLHEFQQRLLALPTELWIELSPQTEQLSSLTPLFFPLAQGGRKLHTDLLSPSQHSLLSGVLP